MGSSISYPNSPVADYLANEHLVETDLHAAINSIGNGGCNGSEGGHETPSFASGGEMVNTCPQGHFLSNSQTLGRMPSARFGSRKSPFQVKTIFLQFFTHYFFFHGSKEPNNNFDDIETLQYLETVCFTRQNFLYSRAHNLMIYIRTYIHSDNQN